MMNPLLVASALAAENIRQKVDGYICIHPPTPDPCELGTQRPCPPSEAEQDISHDSVPG